MAGPLKGIRIVEMAGIGPGPFAAMMLADHGAEVIRVERAGMIGFPNDPLLRNRRSIGLDLKQEAGREVVRRLAAEADGLIESYRPGVMERLGLGPDDLLQANPKLVYGRLTGWGQEGALAERAGHDINYLALTGLLGAIGEPDRAPVPPLNLVADYAGGAMMLAFGMVAALLHVRSGGEGQVIDATMTDGAALTGALVYGMRAAGLWRDARGANLLEGGDPLYGCYACADGAYLALGAVEPKFRAALLEGLGLNGSPDKAAVAAAVRRRTRDDWVKHFAGTDACVTPVLSLAEAPQHPQNAQRGAFVALEGVVQPASAPRYSLTRCEPPRPPRAEGEDGTSILAELGYSSTEIAAMQAAGVLL